MKKKLFTPKKRILYLALAAVLGIALWLAWGNTALMVSEYTVESNRLPASFDGFTIVQISDLHNAEFGEGNKNLLALIEKSKPDLIALTGDLIDSNRLDLEVAVSFAGKAAALAPICFVTGNHESYIEEYETLETRLKLIGVRVLRNEAVALERGDSSLLLIGLDDPAFTLRSDLFKETPAMTDRRLQDLLNKSDLFTILLSHRPELFETYSKNQIDLTLSGHAHGGQVRLPFLGGLVAPNQGFFPKYDAGMFVEGRAHMIVSRGLGNSIIPLRVNNRPEVVVVHLQRSR